MTERPHIVVLDGHTLNPGDLSWDRLEALGHCAIYDRTRPEDVVRRIAKASIVLTNKVVISAESIQQLPNLQYIGVLATGYNVVDVQAACARNIVVTNVPAYGTESVAEMVFAHLLNLCRHVTQHSDSVRRGRWSESNDFCFWDYPLVELSGLTMGIVGLGRIGRVTARLAQAFGMKVIASDIAHPSVHMDDVTLTSLDTIFRESDVISLHCPLTEQNRRFVNRDRLRMMKPTSFLINTSRGPLIDEGALLEALDHGWIAGAGLDVLEQEPPGKDCPLLTARNCFITPHISWATHSARNRLMSIVIENVKAFLSGKPQNVVNTFPDQ